MAVNQAMLQALARQKAAGKTPTGLKSIAKPKDIQDIFDEQLAGASQSRFPNVWRPQSLTGAELENYASFIYGPQKIKLIKDEAIKTNAPTFFAASKSKNPYEQKIVTAIQQGYSPTEIKAAIVQDYEDDNPDLLAFPVTGTSGDVLSTAGAFADTLFSEYNKAVTPAVRDYLTTNDKTFKANLPHPNLKYGQRTNLSKGIIGIETLPSPSVKQFIDTETQKVSQMRKTTPGVAPSSYMDPTAFVVEVVNKKKQTPFKDEALRRQRLKDRNIKP